MVIRHADAKSRTHCTLVLPKDQQTYAPSRQHVPSINQDITPRGITRRIARQVQINALDLSDIALPPQHRHAMRLILTPRTRSHLGIEKSRTNDVNPRKLPPFPRQALPQMCHRGLGRVVHGLVDRYIHYMRRYARRDDQVALALGFEHCANVLRAVEHTVKVDAHLRPVLIQRLFENRSADRHPRVRDEDVDSSEIMDNVSDGIFDLRWIGDLDLVRAHGDIVRFCERGAGRDGGRVGIVPESEVRARFGEGLGDGGADSRTGAGDDRDARGKVKLLQDVRGDVGGRRERGARGGAVVDSHGHRGGEGWCCWSADVVVGLIWSVLISFRGESEARIQNEWA